MRGLKEYVDELSALSRYLINGQRTPSTELISIETAAKNAATVSVELELERATTNTGITEEQLSELYSGIMTAAVGSPDGLGSSREDWVSNAFVGDELKGELLFTDALKTGDCSALSAYLDQDGCAHNVNNFFAKLMKESDPHDDKHVAALIELFTSKLELQEKPKDVIKFAAHLAKTDKRESFNAMLDKFDYASKPYSIPSKKDPDSKKNLLHLLLKREVHVDFVKSAIEKERIKIDDAALHLATKSSPNVQRYLETLEPRFDAGDAARAAFAAACLYGQNREMKSAVQVSPRSAAQVTPKKGSSEAPPVGKVVEAGIFKPRITAPQTPEAKLDYKDRATVITPGRFS